MMGNSHHPRDHRRKEEEQMQEAVEITQAKGRICRDIMSELSDWFTDRDVIEACAKAVETLPMFACVEADTIAGFVALRAHPPAAMEILVIATRRRYHRSGIGKSLLSAAEAFARSSDCKLLTVKTLAPRGRNEPQYEKTRAFYDRNGFIRAETFPTLWRESDPCLFFVKPLTSIN
jgi:GNAT superfamily N-acetyltransferase